jgi:hypothetical protein
VTYAVTCLLDKLDGLEKRLWRLETIVMASTICAVVAALKVLNGPALLTAVSFEMPANHNLICVNG